MTSPSVGIRSETPSPLPPETLTTPSITTPSITTQSHDRLNPRRATNSPLFKESPNHPTSRRNSKESPSHPSSRRNSYRKNSITTNSGSIGDGGGVNGGGGGGRLPRSPDIGEAASRLLKTPDITQYRTSPGSSRRGSRASESIGGCGGSRSPLPARNLAAAAAAATPTMSTTMKKGR